VFNIQPRSFILPNDADEWRLECERFPDGMYIIKPPVGRCRLTLSNRC
jgi:hypothetical protein